MPWPHYALLKPEDLNAVVGYLRTIPPISNAIPPPRRPGIAAYLLGKLKVRLLHQEQPEYLYAGNAGSAAMPEVESRAGQAVHR
jgi:hypothetical protein